MNRAAVLIGVRDAGGGLPRLQTVYTGIAQMEGWANSQGIQGNALTVLIDKQKTVSAIDILQTISNLVNSLSYEQLIIYYSGHGLNLGQSEYWLLSNFLADATTIVNLSTSVEQARTGTIPHVIFISDACRTPAATIVPQIAANRGMPIFPNPSQATIGKFKSVDVFYATILGRPSLEVKDNQNPNVSYRGIYTEALVDALHGNPPMEPENHNGKNVIRPWPLSDYLDNEIPKRLLKLFPTNPPAQVPDSLIASNPKSWISEINPPARELSHAGDVDEPEEMSSPPPPEETSFDFEESTDIDMAEDHHTDSPEISIEHPKISLPQFSRAILRDALDQESFDLDTVLTTADISEGENEAINSLKNSAITTTQPFDRRSFETMCGFQVHGANITEAISNDAEVELLQEAQSACRVSHKDGERASLVLLTFDNGKSSVLPAIHEFITGLRFDPETSELIDVDFEPTEFSSRWNSFQERRQKLRGLRAIISASTRMGTFKLSKENDGAKIAREMQMEKSIDPSLAIYAAYAYRRQGNLNRLDEMYSFLSYDLGVALFDVAMLAGKLSQKEHRLLPPGPMLTQGWAMLDAFEYTLPQGLEELRSHIDYGSLWTIYNQEGYNLLKTFISTD